MPSSAWRRANRFRTLALDRDVEAGGRLVGDDQSGREGQRAGDADPARLAARELVRVALEKIAAQSPTIVEQPRRLRRSDGGRLPVDAKRLGDQGAHGPARAERGDRVLEHHRDLAPER